MRECVCVREGSSNNRLDISSQEAGFFEANRSKFMQRQFTVCLHDFGIENQMLLCFLPPAEFLFFIILLPCNQYFVYISNIECKMCDRHIISRL